MTFTFDQLKDIFVGGAYITEEDFLKADFLKEAPHEEVIDFFIENNYLIPDLVGQAFAEYHKVPYSDLNSNFPTHEDIDRIPADVAKKYKVVFFSEDKKAVTIATSDPTQKGLESRLKKLFPKKKIIITYSLGRDIDDVIRSNYRKQLATRFTQIIKKDGKVAPELLREVFRDAIDNKASDIHFEPMGEQVLVRFRIDGVMHEVGEFEMEYYQGVVNRIKVLARLRIDEHFAAQDGSIRYEQDDIEIDTRVSIVPVLEGEKIVIRLLARYVRGFTLEKIGLESGNREVIREFSKKPFGMILVVGPTGSGKTTTLYALLKLLNKPEVNITTIEDPVEYRINRVNHIQVNKETGLTFAKGLRSIVRQDPDIILVGEVRDKETAEISVNAALTGHLLLSTFHANDAATAMPRLLDMGVEPFLLASTLEVVVAQRLARTICQSCRHSIGVNTTKKEHADLAALFGKKKNITIYKGQGCNACNNTGYKGRTAFFEVIRVTPEMENLLLTNPSSQQIWDLAHQQGSRSLFEDGIEKVRRGVTTVEELFRVSSPPDYMKIKTKIKTNGVSRKKTSTKTTKRKKK